MTKFEREQMSQLNRAMDQYRDALKRLVDAVLNDEDLGPPLEVAENLLK